MQIPFNEIYFNNDIVFASVYKKINELVKGDKFMAEIVNIKADTVTLRLNDNSTLEAKSLVLPDAKIGERVIFAVKENNDGVIKIEFVKDADANIPDNFASGILNKFEIPVNNENRQVIRLMAENNIPLTEENVNKAMFFKYSDVDISSDKLLFLLEENIPAQKDTVSVLNGIMDNSISMKNSIMSICEEIVSIKDTDVGEKLFELLEIDENIFKSDFLNLKNSDLKGLNLKASDFKSLDLKNSDYKNNEVILKHIFNEISDKLFIKLNKDDFKNAEKKLSQIYDIAVKGKKIAENNNEVLTKAFDNVRKNIEFTNHINEYKQYIQIPFSFGANKKEQCELFVFKNPKGSKINTKNASMLLGLDTAFLGRVEVYINKNINSLSMQIKSDKNESLSIMKKNFSKLDALLKNKGYSINAISFKNIDEPFDITKKLENEDNNNNINNKRFSFDMRIWYNKF